MDEIKVTRRAIVAGGVASAVLTHAAHGQGQTAPTADVTDARGTVFEIGADGSRGAGVGGVLVSNGVDVVVTNAQGGWSLPVTPGQSLFVIKPRDWALPLDEETQLPRFSHLHMPDGTPAALGFRFPGVAPTGTLPDSVDFGLRRSPEPDAFDVLLFTDPQPQSLAEVGYVRDDVVAQTEGVPAAFGITTGDLMFDDLAYYGRYNRIVGTIGLPWFNLPGNHDMNFEAPDNAHSKDTFKRVFGARDMAFQHGGATFILLDNVVYNGTDKTKPNGFGGYTGGFSDAQLRFVRNVLAQVPKEALVVYGFHIPLRTLVGTQRFNAATNGRAFLEAISTHPNSLSLSGHTHTQEHWYLGADDGFTGGTHHHVVLAAVSGSWWSGPFDERGIPVALQTDGAPNGFHVLAISGNGYTTTLVPARDPNRSMIRLVVESQMHADSLEVIREYMPGALLGGPVAQDALGSARLMANFYVGGPRSRMEVTVGRGAFQPMTKVTRIDPFVVEVYTRGERTKKPWVKPQPSSHLWQATLPPGLAKGMHRVRVRGTDEYGRVHTAGLVLEVV